MQQVIIVMNTDEAEKLNGLLNNGYHITDSNPIASTCLVPGNSSGTMVSTSTGVIYTIETFE